MSQLYGRGREESYTPSHGYGQNVYIVARASRPAETYEANKKPVVFNYYPSGKTAGPQRYIAEVQTVSREVTRHPVSVMEPRKDYPSHADDQSRRDDDFITKLQDAAMKATVGKLLGINLDQVQGDQVICEDNVCRIIQPSDYHGNSTIKDGWGMQPTSIDENNPKKVAELFNKVSNWQGVNGHDAWNNNPDGRYGYNYPREDHGGSSGWKPSPVYQDYDQITGYGGDTQSSTNYGNSHYGGYGSHGKPDDSYTGRNNNPQAPLSGRSYTDQGDIYVGSSGRKERPSTPQAYYQTTHHGGDTCKNPNSINGSYGNSDNMVSGNHSRIDDSYTRRSGPQAPRAGSGYTGQTENLNGSSGLNTPLSTQKDYDQPVSYARDTHRKPSSVKGYHSDSEDCSYGNHGKLGAPQAGSGYTDQTEKLNGSSGWNKPLSTQQGYDGRNNNPQAPRAGSGYPGQTENLNNSSGLNKPLSTQQRYGQPTSYGGDTHKNPSSMNHSNSEDEGYGNRSRLNDSLTKRTNNPQALQAGSGYTGQAENFKHINGLNKPHSTQQGYDQPVSYGGDTRKDPSSMSGNYSNSEGKGYGNCAKPDYSYNGRNNNPQAPQGRYDYNKTGVDYDGGNGDDDGINTRRKPINTTKRNKPKYEVHGNG